MSTTNEAVVLDEIELGDFVEITYEEEGNTYLGRTGGRIAVAGRVIDVDEREIALAVPGETAERRIARKAAVACRLSEPPLPSIGVLDPAKRPILVRLYPGRKQADAANLYAEESLYLAAHGYLPVAQSWAQGEPGIGRLVALGLVGAVAFRPKGALTVTYIHESARMWHASTPVGEA